MNKTANPVPGIPGGDLASQMQAHQNTQHDSSLGDMALTGGALGLGAGAAAVGLGAIGRALINARNAVQNKGLRGRRKPLYGSDPTGVPVVEKLALENPIVNGMTTDPLHGLKLTGVMGAPLLGGYLLARGAGNLWKKKREKDEAQAVQGEYQKALQDYATTASGLKLASTASALDKLAAVKTASFPTTFGELSGQLSNPVAVASIGSGALFGALYHTPRILKRLKQQKELKKQKEMTTAASPPAAIKTASPSAANLFGLLGQGNPMGEAATVATNVAVPAALLYGGFRLHQGMKKRKEMAEQAKKVQDNAVSDWRRKELFFRPPAIQANPEPIV